MLAVSWRHDSVRMSLFAQGLPRCLLAEYEGALWVMPEGISCSS